MVVADLPVFFLSGVLLVIVGLSRMYDISMLFAVFRTLPFFAVMVIIGSVLTSIAAEFGEWQFTMLRAAAVTAVIIVFYRLSQASLIITSELIDPERGSGRD